METLDGRVIEARAALAEARQRDPGALTRDELIGEITSFRTYVRWLIDVADDAADTDIDEEVSQVTLWGGVYIAPTDTRKLCDSCLALLGLVWEAGPRGAPAPAPAPAGPAPSGSGHPPPHPRPGDAAASEVV
jgi:hypothetical protein